MLVVKYRLKHSSSGLSNAPESCSFTKWNDIRESTWYKYKLAYERANPSIPVERTRSSHSRLISWQIWSKRVAETVAIAQVN